LKGYLIVGLGLLLVFAGRCLAQKAAPDRLRLIIETDAGGDPDDEQSLVRFLLYVTEWDIEGIIANRLNVRNRENANPERTGVGIVRRLLRAYGECHPNLVLHDPRYPKLDQLWERTVAGYDNTQEAVHRIIETVDRPDPRPVWYSDWGTDNGAATNNLKRALDRVLRERGPRGYATFKNRLRLSSADKFGQHTSRIQPAFALWVDTFRPELNGRRWYHRFSAVTARAGGFDLVRDVLTGHGSLGALYPTNTTHWGKEGDSMTFLYLVPTGMNDPNEPRWGSWAGRYGLNTNFPGCGYFWANEEDASNGATNRDNTLARWAVALQNDFRARLDWCVKPYAEANHAPRVVVNGPVSGDIVRVVPNAGTELRLDASLSLDPDGNQLRFDWFLYPEAGDYTRAVQIRESNSSAATVQIPHDAAGKTIHVLVAVTDDGVPALTRYHRVIITPKHPAVE
jgi:Cellulose-binding Sde182, nucleoside hydrolase-like domain/Cellulose-binding protein Sde0182, C-terminal domain